MAHPAINHISLAHSTGFPTFFTTSGLFERFFRERMNIHEYQARDLFEKFGVATPRGNVASTPEEAEAVARQLGTDKIVIKAQIHAGGRGKGTFTNGFQGGVHVCKTPEEIKCVAAKMLGQTLVTHQTGAAGRLVSKVFVAEAKAIEKELYIAILLDRASSTPVIIASTEGGMDIEAVAAKTPEKIFREPVHPLLGLQAYQTRKLARALGLTGKQASSGAKLIAGLYKTSSRAIAPWSRSTRWWSPRPAK